MLNALRKSAGTWVIRILLGLLILSFGLWGVDGIFSGGAARNVAEVGDRDISIVEFQRAYERQKALISARLGRRLTDREARSFGITQNVLQNLVQTTALDIHASELGLGISTEAIRNAIQTEPAFLDAEGNFSTARFQEALRNLGLSEQGLVAQQRGDMIRQQLVGALGEGVAVPRTLIEALYHHRNDTRTLDYFVIGPDAAAKVGEPDEAALKAYYEANKTRYTAPEYRKIGMLTLTPDTVENTISLTDEELRTQYEATKSQHGKPERRTIQQLIFDDMAAARDASEKLKQGKDFVELGKELGMTESDINLGTFAKDGLANPAVAEAAFTLEQGETSAPIESFSPTIVKVTNVQEGQQKTFEEAKEEVRSALAGERARIEIQNLYDAVEDARAGGANVKEAAEKLNLPYAEYSIDRQGQGQDGKPVEPIAGNRAALQLTYESDVGVENNPVTQGEGYAFIDVLEVIPERQKTFGEVRDQVKAAWIADETQKTVRVKAEELVKKAEGNATLEELAKEVGATVSKTQALKRQANPNELPRTAVSLAFTLPEDSVGNVRMGNDGQQQAILRVSEAAKAPPLDEKQAETLRTEIRQAFGRDIVTQYIGALQNDYGVNVNDKALSTVFTP